MIRCTINDRPLEVPAGTTLLQAARAQGISIPTLCHREGYPAFASCMLCVVRDQKSGNLLPACSALVQDGMAIETDSEAVHEARKAALELLLSDHSGECLAPCQRTCPAHMDIPMMHHHIEAGRTREALQTVKQTIALPAVLGYICSAPCESGCRLKQVGGSLSICALKRYVAEEDLNSEAPYLPAVQTATGKKVAIIGSGPTGLAAAYYLQQEGHACTLFDKNPEPGGALRYEIPEAELPRSVLDAEIGIIASLGAEFRMNTALGQQISFEELRGQFDAIVLAAGRVKADDLGMSDLESARAGIHINSETFETSIRGVFAGGGAVRSGKMAVRSVADGKAIAASVHQYLGQGTVTRGQDQFYLRMRNMDRAELDGFIEEQKHKFNISGGEELFTRVVERDNVSPEKVGHEAGRCLHCGCLKTDTCMPMGIP